MTPENNKKHMILDSAFVLPSRRLLLHVLCFLILLVCVRPAHAQSVGLHCGSDFATSQYDSFGTWLGRAVGYRVVFVDKTNWTTMTQAAVLDTSKKWVNSKSGRVEVLSLGMWANGHTGGFSTILNGSKDSAFRTIAQKIQSLGIAKQVIVRLAWEANGDWYSWSYQKDPASFKASWRRIVSIMRSAAPGLRFEFNISNLATRGSSGAKWTAGYPGDDVVDVISMDIYDHWNSWSTMMNGDAGLKEMRDFAIAHNKPEAYAEWAVVTTSNGHGDNAGFIRAMSSWMKARPGKVLYQSYWNTTGGGIIFPSDKVAVPSAASTYKEMFGAAAASSSNSTPTISSIGDQTIDVNGSTGTIKFTVGDSQTSPSSLTLVKNSSDTSLIPLSRIVLGGSGANRTVSISPVPNKSGWSTIWLKVSDGKLSSVKSFVVHVSPQLTFANVGTPEGTSGHSFSGSAVTMRSGGKDIYNRSDDFHYGSMWLDGDAELTVKVSSLSAADPWSKAGLMFRASGASNSAFVGVFVTPSHGVALQWRTSAGAYASSSETIAGKAPQWLRLVRSADSFYAYTSKDGVDWDLVDTAKVVLPDTCLAGLALTAHTSSTQAVATFDKLAVD